MSNLNYNESVTLPSDRYQIYTASKFGRFKPMEAVESLSVNLTRPSEIKDQVGDEQHRGMSLKQPVIAIPLSRLLVDATIPQLISDKMGWINVAAVNEVGTSLSGDTGIFAQVVAPITDSGKYEVRAIAQDKVRLSISGGAVEVASTNVGKVGVIDGAIEVCVLDLSGLLRANDTAVFSVATIDHWDVEKDYKESSVDLRVVKKDGTGNIFETWYAPDMAALNGKIGLTADGDATESVDFETEIFQKYDGYVLKRQVYVDSLTSGTREIVFETIESESGIVVPQEHKTGSPYAGKYFMKVAHTTTAGVKTILTEVSGVGAATGEVKYDRLTTKLNVGDKLNIGDRLEMTFYSLKVGSVAESFSETFGNDPISIPGDYTPITIGANQFDRATAVNINMAFKRDRKPFLGETDVKYSLGKVPDITGDVSANDEDLELIKLLSKGSATDADTEFYAKEIGDYTNENSVQLVATLKDPADNTTVMIKYTIPSVVVTEMPHAIAVNSDTTRNFNWTNKYGTMDIDRNV